MVDPLASMNAWGSPLPPQKDDLPPVPTHETDVQRTPNNGNNDVVSPDFQRDPRTYGVPGPTLIDSSSTAAERGQPAIPFIRVRLGSMDRNKKDLLIRFDLSVRAQFLHSIERRRRKLTSILLATVDQSTFLPSYTVPQHPTIIRRLYDVCRTDRLP